MTQVFVNPAIAQQVPDMEDPLIVFFHAQRTGGSRFRHVLAEIYGQDHVYATQWIDDFKHWKDLTPAELDEFRAFAGHSNYEPIGMVRPCLMVSLLRHPVYRAMSLYFYCQTKDGHALREMANSLDMFSFYREASSWKPHYFQEVQCRRISGVRKADAAIEMIHSSYLAIGSVEALPEFIGGVGDALRWPSVDVSAIPADSERYSQHWSDDFAEMVLDGNMEDMRLYEYFEETLCAP